MAGLLAAGGTAANADNFWHILSQRMDTDLQALLSSSSFLEDIQIRAILYQVLAG